MYDFKRYRQFVSLIKSDSIKLVLSKSKDNCNLRLVDSTVSNFLRNPTRQSFDILSSIANKSDGYISEYIVEKMGKVYYTKFEPFFDFLYDDFVNKKKNRLEGFLIECWSSIAATSDNAKAATSKIRNNTQAIVKKKEANLQNRMNYLNSLLAKINSKYLD